MIIATTDWPTGSVQLEWTEDCYTNLPVTGSHGFCFTENGVVVINIRSRGLTIPGGHLENGETPEQCLIREVAEEAQVTLGELHPIGFIVSDHSKNPDYSGPYPVRAAQAVFVADVVSMALFVPTTEASERRIVSPDDLPSLHHEWNAVLDAAYIAAKATVSGPASRAQI